MLTAALLDVGGTLWPDRIARATGPDPRLAALARVLPSVEVPRALASIDAQLRRITDGQAQDTHGLIAEALEDMGMVRGSFDPMLIRRALCAPAISGIQLFPHARELLSTLRELGVRCVVVSNALVRGADEYWRDFSDLGVADLIDGVVTSIEVGFRKPHPAMYEAAMRMAGGDDPRRCVMVGNSEANDIQPAVQLGMRTIRVAIEEDAPQGTAADAVATNLLEVASVIREWASAGLVHRDV